MGEERIISIYGEFIVYILRVFGGFFWVDFSRFVWVRVFLCSL